MPGKLPSAAFQKIARIPVGRDQLLSMVEYSISPLVLSLSLWAVAFAFDGYLAPEYVVLSLVVFALTFPGSGMLPLPVWRVAGRVAANWLIVFGLLYAFGYASDYLSYFDRDILFTWFWIAPTGEFAGHLILRVAAPKILELQGPQRRAIVAGMNPQGFELANRLVRDPYSRTRVIGFFDDRSSERVNGNNSHNLLGKIDVLPAFVKKNRVDLIYIALPMASQPRILSLLDALRDTTASIYFVPDIFVTDLIQGRIDSVNGVPVVAVCESPFTGMNGVIKRTSDVVLSLTILTFLALPMLAIAIAVKASSPGPAIFRQRRYGLDGREIVVYKFRTMTVREDGDVVTQAQKNDPRVTRVGSFLRRTSLDELPQFFNVLQGRMSIVGPRPHAVAHNEAYRKLIKGYMQRHKVKPGITGWAQVNGLRGETETVEKMKARIDYDLEYLRNWSLRFDLYIILRTIWVVLARDNAY